VQFSVYKNSRLRMGKSRWRRSAMLPTLLINKTGTVRERERERGVIDAQNFQFRET